MSQDLEQQYKELDTRYMKLSRDHAVAVEREEQKAARRDSIIETLKALDIDYSNPESEIARLEQENEQAYEKAKRELDEFEVQLKGGETADALEPETLKVADASSDVGTDDLDI